MSAKCQVCTKNVYAMEKLEVEGVAFHKTCFRCETCKRTLSTGSYASLEGKYYCKPHLKQLFALKGNYDEGFGRDTRKSDWERKGDAGKPAPAKPAPVKKEAPPPASEPEPEPEPEAEAEAEAVEAQEESEVADEAPAAEDAEEEDEE